MKAFLTSRLNLKLLSYHLKYYKSLIFIFTIILMTSFPIPLLVSYFNNVTASTITYLVRMFLFTLLTASLILIILSPFIFFNFLFKKRAIDIYHALPIRRRDLYITYVLGSLLIVLIPLTIAYLTGYGLAHFAFGMPINATQILTFCRIVVILIAINSITCFVIMNTGTLSDAIIYTAILTIAPFIIFIAIQYFASNFIPGFGMRTSDGLTLFSPHYALFQCLYAQVGHYSINTAASFWFILTLLIHVVSSWIYNERKSERSEEPFTNHIFFTLITSLFTSALLIGLIAIWSSSDIGTLNQLTPTLLIFPLLMCYVVYLLLNIIKNRSPHKIKTISQNYGLVVIITLFLCITLYITEGFGFTTRVPDMNTVRYVDIHGPSAYGLNFLGKPLTKLRLTKDEDIEAFVKTHEALIDTVQKMKKFGFSTANTAINDTIEFTFTYQLKNGTKLNRAFETNRSVLTQLEMLLTSPAVQKQLNPIMSKTYKPTITALHNANLTKTYNFKGDYAQLGEIYQEETSSYSFDDYTKNGQPLEFILVYGDERGLFQLNIDTRHTRSLKYIQDNIVSASPTAYNYSLKTPNLDKVIVVNDIPQDYQPYTGTINTVNMQHQSNNAFMISTPISKDEVTQYDTKLYSYHKQTQWTSYLEVVGSLRNIDYPFTMRIPIIE